MNTKLFLIIAVALLSLLISIIIVRIVLYLGLTTIDYTQKKWIKPKTPEYKKPDEDLLRDKGLEAKKEKEQIKSATKINNKLENIENEHEEKIVGIVKPIGFWTSLVIGKGLTNMMRSRKFTDIVMSRRGDNSLSNEADRGGRQL
jgi:hypothetical protein